MKSEDETRYDEMDEGLLNARIKELTADWPEKFRKLNEEKQEKVIETSLAEQMQRLFNMGLVDPNASPEEAAWNVSTHSIIENMLSPHDRTVRSDALDTIYGVPLRLRQAGVGLDEGSLAEADIYPHPNTIPYPDDVSDEVKKARSFVSRTCDEAQKVDASYPYNKCVEEVTGVLKGIRLEPEDLSTKPDRWLELSYALADRLVQEHNGEVEEKSAIRQALGTYTYEVDFGDIADEEDLFPPKKVLEFLRKALKGRSFEFRRGDRTHYWDYTDGKAKQVRIGSALDKLNAPKEVRQAMTTMPTLGKYNVEIEISDRPEDVINKSRNQHWTSCEKWPDGDFGMGAVTDVREANGIAIVRTWPKGGKRSDSWTARISLRNCRDADSGFIDVGVEPRMYGGSKQLHRFVRARLNEILKDKGLLDYTSCTTDYEYQGWSDTNAGREDEGIDPSNTQITFGELRKPEVNTEWLDELREEYDFYGACRMRTFDTYSDMYWRGQLRDLLDGLDARDYDEDSSFAQLTDCEPIEDDDPQYRAWEQYGEAFEAFMEELDDVPHDKLVLGVPVTIYAHGEALTDATLPLLVDTRLGDSPDSAPWDSTKYEKLLPILHDANECFDKATKAWDERTESYEGDDTEGSWRRLVQDKEKCALDAFRKIFKDPRAEWLPTDDDSPGAPGKWAEGQGDRAYLVCAQLNDRLASFHQDLQEIEDRHRLTRVNVRNRGEKEPSDFESLKAYCRLQDPEAMERAFAKASEMLVDLGNQVEERDVPKWKRTSVYPTAL